MSKLLLKKAPAAASQMQPSRNNHSAEAVLIGREAEALQQITNPGVAATIWHRNPIASFQDWVDGLPPEQLPELRTIAPLDRVESVVQAACDAKDLPAGPERNRLASDVAALAFIFGQIMDVPNVQLRFDVDDGVMCPKFHIDNVAARLLCTYRGPGTEYVTTADLDGPKQIGQIATGSVGLFRGKKWPSLEGCTLLHRSPQLAPGSLTRLLLVIDTAG
nr:DUF1826 domain-containing protein [uncultured Cohaesibacter sp.]